MGNPIATKLTALALGAGLTAAAVGTAAAQTTVIATDRQGSLMNRVGTAMAKNITDNSDIRAVVRPFAGPDAYMDAFDRGEIQFSVLTSSSTYVEVTGTNKSKKAHKNIRLVRSGPNVINLGFIVHSDSPAKTVADLKGRKMTSDFGGHSVLPKSIATGLANAGLTWDDVVKVPVTGVVDGIKAVGAGRAETSWAAVGMPVVREINAQKPVRFLSFSNTPERLAKMREMLFPGLKLRHFPRPVPPLSITNPVYLITYDTYLLAHKDADAGLVTKVTEALWKGTDAMVKSSPIFSGFTHANAVTDVPMAPYHPAAAAFYKAQGKWNDMAMKGNEKAEMLVK